MSEDSKPIALGPNRRNAWQISETHADLVRAPRPALPARLRAEPKDCTIDLARTAMVVVDMQNDFCHRDGWLASIGVDVAPARTPIDPLRRLLPALRGAGVPIVWANWGNRPDLANLSPHLLHIHNPTGRGHGLGDRLPGTGAAVLEKNSWSAAIVEELVAEPADIHVDKYRMSGFWDTPLDSILRNLDVTTLLFGGVNADQCVLHTLADANFLGYDTLMVSDCTATTSPGYCWDATVFNVKRIFGFVVSSESLIAALP